MPALEAARINRKERETMRLFSTEQVSKYHPDKFCDQISDAILDACIFEDEKSRVACEALAKGTMVVLAGEITTRAKVDYAEVARRVGKKLGYKVDTVIQNIVTQSREIAGGVKDGAAMGAGDQGIMFGYACDESEALLPYGFNLANEIIAAIEKDTPHGDYFTGDAKCQVTVDLDEPDLRKSVKKVLVSACTKDNYIPRVVRGHIRDVFEAYGVDIGDAELIVNPAGVWTLGGPAADCGLTGRKIVCDQYGGYCPVGGGAFSGKDPTKVDRSGAYMARKIACDLLKKHGLKWCEAQIGYAIGQAEPMSVAVNSNLRISLEDEVKAEYDLTPWGIINRLALRSPIYEDLAEGCHYRAMT